MQKVYITAIFLLIAFSFNITWSQNLLTTINQTEKAIIHIRTFKKGMPLATSAGFLLSSNGITLIPGSTIFQADSAIVTGSNGRKYAIKRILSCHPLTNFTLIKLSDPKNKGFKYLLPSQNHLYETEQILAFNHPKDNKEGSYLTNIEKVTDFPLLGRVATIPSATTENSTGMPIINSQGKLVGILSHYAPTNAPFIFNIHLINDTNWININQPIKKLDQNSAYQTKIHPFISEGIKHIIFENWIEASKSLSREIKTNTNNDLCYSFRGFARYNYRNTIGSREDFKYSLKLNPQNFLTYYFRAILNNDNEKLTEKLANLDSCLMFHKNFAHALTERGKFYIYRKINVNKALNDFSDAIVASPVCAEAFYERGKILINSLIDKDLAIEDFNQAILLNPRLPGIFTIRGTIKFEQEDYLNAINDFNKAIERDNQDEHALFNRGAARYNLGMKRQACLDWQRAGDLGHYKAFRYISRYCTKNK